MENQSKEITDDNKNIKSVLLGLLFGSLTGAIAMLLFAPQSGKRTRTQIYQGGIELRDRTTTEVNKAAEQVRSETERITTEVREKVGDLKQLGQDKLAEQMEHVSMHLDAWNMAAEAA
jgi:gas vesicle protein